MASFGAKLKLNVCEPVHFEIGTKEEQFYIVLFSTGSECVVTLIDDINTNAQTGIAHMYDDKGEPKSYDSVWFNEGKVGIRFFFDSEKIAFTIIE